MIYYELSKEKRAELNLKILSDIEKAVSSGDHRFVLKYASDEDTYIRKACYLNISKLYFQEKALAQKLINLLLELVENLDFKVRQTVVNAFGEIGKQEPEKALDVYQKAMFDKYHSVRNAVIGSLKKMGEKKPKEVIDFCEKFISHTDPEIRRQVIHGIELRGRTHPEDILPLLKKLQWEKVPRVRNMVIHVVGQISYKKGCLDKVLNHLNGWENESVVEKCLKEIVETHESYKKFSELKPLEAREKIKQVFPVYQF